MSRPNVSGIVMTPGNSDQNQKNRTKIKQNVFSSTYGHGRRIESPWDHHSWSTTHIARQRTIHASYSSWMTTSAVSGLRYPRWLTVNAPKYALLIHFCAKHAFLYKYALTCNICAYVWHRIISIGPRLSRKAISHCPHAGPYRAKKRRIARKCVP